jgi:hypothetical protein
MEPRARRLRGPKARSWKRAADFKQPTFQSPAHCCQILMRSTLNIALLALSRSQSQLSRGQLWYSGAAKKKLFPQSATPPRWSSATLKRQPRRHNLCGDEHRLRRLRVRYTPESRRHAAKRKSSESGQERP